MILVITSRIVFYSNSTSIIVHSNAAVDKFSIDHSTKIL